MIFSMVSGLVGFTPYRMPEIEESKDQVIS